MNKAIYFDLDNTLVHRRKSISAYAEKFFIDYVDALIDTTPEKISNVIVAQDNGGYLVSDSPYASIKEAIASELHKNFICTAEINIAVIRDHWVSVFPQSTVPMQGANELLSSLAVQGYHLGIISNGAELSRLSTAGTLRSYRYIKQLTSSERAGTQKPNSEIFITTIRDAGFKPDQCWYIGDHPINDIDGARKAGMQTIWLEGFHSWPADLLKPRHSVACLSEIEVILSSGASLNR